MAHDFRFISKHAPEVRNAYDELMELLSLVHKDMRKRYTFQHKFVGSYSRNMMTWDIKSKCGPDFDVNIYPNYDEERYSAEEIKRWFRESLNKFCKRFGYDFAEDSTRVLTIKVKDRKNSAIVFSVDFAFVRDYEEDGYDCQEYIHFNKKQNSYYWAQRGEGFYQVPEQFEWLVKNGYKQELLNEWYIPMKNNNSDPNKHSCSLLAEAVNACYRYYYEENERQENWLGFSGRPVMFMQPDESWTTQYIRR